MPLPDLARLSLGEGMTPVVCAPELAELVGVAEVWLKLDQLNPTGSFKDRAVAAGVAHALANRAPGVVCASSGNAAASAAAYAARAGLPAIVLVPVGTPAAKVAAANAHGARILAVPGGYSAAFALGAELCAELGYANVATTYVNPHAVAALRTVGYELHEQLPGLTDVYVPTSAGPLVHGVVAGYRDLGVPVPRPVVAQPAGCAPIARAYRAGHDTVEPWRHVDTRVSGLDDALVGYPTDGTHTLRSLRSADGRAVALDDDEIDAARRLLARQCGVHAEPAAAASVAALLRPGTHRHSDRVACLITGHGMKAASDPPVLPTVDSVDAVRGLM
ncbi:threonine synthase [Actinocatenispora rupis]|uniref:Threonine synthase n=1 Tax=Actinocatenispora rupis TaxID=519421 RepID=A0A8J3JBC8_9ACTN|nr:threonine synthase [Actinocatenispora rupis]